MTWRNGLKAAVGAVLAAGLVGCAFSPPTPRKDTRPLQPGAELADEVGKTTEALLATEGQDRIRYASSLDPETDGAPVRVEPPFKKEAPKVEPEADPKPEPDAAKEDDAADTPAGDAEKPKEDTNPEKGEDAAPEGEASGASETP